MFMWTAAGLQREFNMKKIPDFSKIKMLVCDFDGVMTDNTVIVDQHGNEAVRCNRGDGLGIDMLKAAGIKVYILSKEKNPVVAARAKKLQVPVFHGIDDKIEIFKQLADEEHVPMDQVCFIGNDVNDLECVAAAGIGAGVNDSHPRIIEAASFITEKRGGEGAVREIAEKILFAEN